MTSTSTFAEPPSSCDDDLGLGEAASNDLAAELDRLMPGADESAAELLAGW